MNGYMLVALLQYEGKSGILVMPMPIIELGQMDTVCVNGVGKAEKTKQWRVAPFLLLTSFFLRM